MLRVALTGNIASGKSAVATIWKDMGALVIDADELARRAVEPGTPGLARIIKRWGTGVLSGDELDRSAMRDIVFRNPDERRHLESIVHPEVHRLRGLEEERAAAEGRAIVIADIPLLFEVGMEDDFDLVVLVDAPENVRLQRLVRHRGLTREEARRMIDAQWPSERKRSRADYVIDNDGSLDELSRRAREVWARLEQREGAGA